MSEKALNKHIKRLHSTFEVPLFVNIVTIQESRPSEFHLLSFHRGQATHLCKVD